MTMAIARQVASVTRLGIEDVGNCHECYIFLQATMGSIGIPTRLQTAFPMSEVAEPYIGRRAVRHLEKGRVVIFAAGIGNPFFNTAAALRCAESHIKTEMTHLDKLTLPFPSPAVVVFNLNKPGNIEKAIKGERVGTLIGATWNSTMSRT